ncbi:MAG TPA: isoprenylcysteine carboxylmethyltransferase family protein [Candidatus Acidoferrales bacterium]|nr:isoprenylcysteine carboxylmethyltransferase family protein [Candidatus Acidoferrales bacterium]
MTFFGWIAGLVLWANLPVPIFWLVLHTRVEFWRRRVGAAFTTAIVAGWGSATALAWLYGQRLLDSEAMPLVARIAGLLLIAFDVWAIVQVERQLGVQRLMGRAELAGIGEIKRDGIYGLVRHPRYAAMMVSTLGACLVAARPAMWGIAAGWAAVVLLMIRAEERELVARFGAKYEEYRRGVPALVPRLRGTHRD